MGMEAANLFLNLGKEVIYECYRPYRQYVGAGRRIGVMDR
ncbi:hypothetical protein YPC_4604 [Yersinia pestis biovar Medievalis str. Harbin 35]|nr:hypothetical protein YPC_4604 [Yersinia pestis biovar Medievalis str. Harbin 35]EEO74636.1 hypothetical protein YP516_4239 [Yersinia pestis Nepal516]EEO83266.1 hypothetical protein YPF_0199 [Yersinia pestis biovar Orientalis str. India 195]EEO86203.1 hypothetical protein YPH_2112 [Yersinia pestis biovar Orientalis str. PEXU2]EEO88326.1 hypothetical protein YPS_4588 [Yersinia pestis Pestoides A]